MCKKDDGIVMPNFAVLARGVFVIYEKPPGGGADIRPPSVRGFHDLKVELSLFERKADKQLFAYLYY